MSSAILERTASAAVAAAKPSLLAVHGLRKSYRSGDRLLEVLRGVDFHLAPA